MFKPKKIPIQTGSTSTSGVRGRFQDQKQPMAKKPGGSTVTVRSYTRRTKSA